MTPKSKLGRIDDTFDAAKAAYPKNEDYGPASVALSVGSLLSPVLGLVKEASTFFSAKAGNERLNVLIEVVNDKAEHLSEQVDGLQTRIGSLEFRTAFREACVQTMLPTERTKIEQFGAVLGGSLGAEDWPEISGNLTSFIKALAQLGEKDIQCLQLLETVFADVVKTYPNMHDPNPFTEKARDLLRGAREAGFHPDDFYAHCRRLEGFGLAMEVPRNTSRMAPGDYCFRPTRTGLRLLGLLAKQKVAPTRKNAVDG